MQTFSLHKTTTITTGVLWVPLLLLLLLLTQLLHKYYEHQYCCYYYYYYYRNTSTSTSHEFVMFVLFPQASTCLMPWMTPVSTVMLLWVLVLCVLVHMCHHWCLCVLQLQHLTNPKSPKHRRNPKIMVCICCSTMPELHMSAEHPEWSICSIISSTTREEQFFSMWNTLTQQHETIWSSVFCVIYTHTDTHTHFGYSSVFAVCVHVITWHALTQKHWLSTDELDLFDAFGPGNAPVTVLVVPLSTCRSVCCSTCGTCTWDPADVPLCSSDRRPPC